MELLGWITGELFCTHSDNNAALALTANWLLQMGFMATIRCDPEPTLPRDAFDTRIWWALRKVREPATGGRETNRR